MEEGEISMLFCSDHLGIRILTEADAPLLVKWLTDPQVLEFYEGRDRPHDLEMVKRHFFKDPDPVTRCMVVYRNREIGYVQFYPILEEEREEYGCQDEQGALFGMDQFIGETEYWNQGIGTSLVKCITRHLVSLGADAIVMDPQTWNVRALRCYEKCGFRKVKLLPKHEWHEGAERDCWLIEYRAGGKAKSPGNKVVK